MIHFGDAQCQEEPHKGDYVQNEVGSGEKISFREILIRLSSMIPAKFKLCTSIFKTLGSLYSRVWSRRMLLDKKHLSSSLCVRRIVLDAGKYKDEHNAVLALQKLGCVHSKHSLRYLHLYGLLRLPPTPTPFPPEQYKWAFIFCPKK